ncbi:UNVERIFIED_CONTAM: hypothetical protein K2H54_049444 [Gekko kuhli]
MSKLKVKQSLRYIRLPQHFSRILVSLRRAFKEFMCVRMERREDRRKGMPEPPKLQVPLVAVQHLTDAEWREKQKKQEIPRPHLEAGNPSFGARFPRQLPQIAVGGHRSHISFLQFFITISIDGYCTPKASKQRRPEIPVPEMQLLKFYARY